jgi:hypothetical protein
VFLRSIATSWSHTARNRCDGGRHFLHLGEQDVTHRPRSGGRGLVRHAVRADVDHHGAGETMEPFTNPALDRGNQYVG